jgi:glycosyltransferase involved in cell wall biosynthesis
VGIHFGFTEVRHVLIVIETHPVQYHAPVYRALQQRFHIPTTVIYGSDFSIAGYKDREFNVSFAWDTDLLDGYTSVFLGRAAEGGATSDSAVTSTGLRQALLSLKPSAVLVIGYSPRFYRDACVQALRLNCRKLFRGETTDHARKRGKLKRWLRDQVLSALYSRFDRLLYVGSRSRAHFRRLGVSDSRLVFSPYCVDTGPFQLDEVARQQLRGRTRSDLNILPNSLVIVFSGKLSPRKGPDLLLAAVKRLPEHLRSRIVLLFLGDGELKEQLAADAKQMPAVQARFVGFQNQRNLSAFYHASDLLALPSIWSETWGLVVNDALHHGLPCVVSDNVGCAPDLLVAGKTGEICETGSLQDLTLTLLRSFEWIHKPGVRKACLEKASEYTVQRAALGISEAFHAVCTPARRSSTATVTINV